MNIRPQILPEGCQIINIPCVRDARGALVFAEAESCVPFPVKRVFWIFDVPDGARRGGHAHWECAEVVVAVSGGLKMTLDDGRLCMDVEINNPDEGLLIPAGVWCELHDFLPGTVLVVMASHPYDAEGYVNDYESYLNLKKNR